MWPWAKRAKEEAAPLLEAAPAAPARAGVLLRQACEAELRRLERLETAALRAYGRATGQEQVALTIAAPRISAATTEMHRLLVLLDSTAGLPGVWLQVEDLAAPASRVEEPRA